MGALARANDLEFYTVTFYGYVDDEAATQELGELVMRELSHQQALPCYVAGGFNAIDLNLPWVQALYRLGWKKLHHSD
eukprot:580633-Amphidinium_carterae.4